MAERGIYLLENPVYVSNVRKARAPAWKKNMAAPKQGSIAAELNEHLPRIRNIVRRVARDEGVVDDIVQECCIRIIEKEGLCKKEDRVAQWINAVTRNFTINFLVKRNRENSGKLSLIEDQVAGPESLEAEFSEEHIGWMLSQFQTLPRMQRKVLQMRYFEGKKTIDIAKELKISQPVVSIHVQRAIASLKKRARAQGLLAILLPWNWALWDQVAVPLKVYSKAAVATTAGKVGVAVTCAAAVTTGVVATSPGETPPVVPAAKEQPAQVVVPVEKPKVRFEVATWNPIGFETPSWMYPSLRVPWGENFGRKKVENSPEKYAQRFINRIKNRKAEQPVWLVTQNWYGLDKPGRNRNSAIAHTEDETTEGTPGLWPEEGMKIWMARTTRFIRALKEANVKVDTWTVYNHVAIHAYEGNFGQPYAFHNMIKDPRWSSKKFMGLPFRGIDLFDPKDLGKADWLKHRKGKVYDNKLAAGYASVVGWFVTHHALEQSFGRVAVNAFPDTQIGWLSRSAKSFDFDDPDHPMAIWRGHHRADKARWEEVMKLIPGDNVIPGVGNVGMYGLGLNEGTRDDRVAHSERLMDEAIRLNQNDPSKVIIWIHALPGPADDKVTLPEFKLILEAIARRGIKKVFLWNSEISGGKDEAYMRSLVEVFKEVQSRS